MHQVSTLSSSCFDEDQGFDPPADFHHRLDRAVDLCRVNEDFLWQAFEQLTEQPYPDEAAGLGLKRLTELALWLAGSYADEGQMREVGDLLFNPRRKLLYVKGRSQPIELARHRSLTEQFGADFSHRGETIDWLKNQTCLRPVGLPLLPALGRELARLCGPEDGYVLSVARRLDKITATVAFWAGSGQAGLMSPAELLRTARAGDREFIQGELCLFDLTEFHRLGRLV